MMDDGFTVYSRRSKQKRSKSEPLIKTRKVFNGVITASIILVSDSDGLSDVCSIYESSNKDNLMNDRPFKVCSLTIDQIKKFPKAKTNELSYLVTADMEEKAYSVSKNYELGWDFVLKDSIKNDRLSSLDDRLSILCEIVLPSLDNEYPNIDVTSVTEKTEIEDKNIIYTAKRGLLEEIGIDMFTDIGTEIFRSKYQKEYRKKYCKNLPYNFKLGEHGKATECLVICAEAEDILDCQNINEQHSILLEESNYRRYERMINDLVSI